ncbi:uncharacterized protein LOC134813034 isoform X2 [Bolinopsis microptera]|uniref:uncharacterized protein LOC134813034 isoform X2 n=1 Tax=Bolinopsis microptera TaxID=2820187 RepID=UPI003079139A
MVSVLVWMSFLIFIPGSHLDNNLTCAKPNLFDEFRDKFGKKNETLKVNGGFYNKCLHMYEKDTKLKVDENTIRAISEKVNKLAGGIIEQIAEDEGMDHSDYLPAFMETCFVKSHLEDFAIKLNKFFKKEYKMKLTCPLGLLWDIICTFQTCLESDCVVDDEVCTDANDTNACSKVNLKLFCMVDFGSFVDSCVDDENQFKIPMKQALSAVLRNSSCSNFNYIYQGMPSLQVIEKSVIAADCGEVIVTMKCFRNGEHLKQATWSLKDVKDADVSNGALHISRKDILLNQRNFSCYDGPAKVADITSHHLLKLCNSDRGNEVSNDIDIVIELDDDNGNYITAPPEPTSTTPHTSSTPQPIDKNRNKWKDFYKDDKIWLFRKYSSLDGINAFDNKNRLQTNIDKLSVAMVSVMGRLTPICGELWNKEAAAVFCREAGAQLSQNWTVLHVGSLHKTKNERHNESDFYKHYLRNITCKGDEAKIIWCEHDGWYHHSNCTHDAVVTCSQVKEDPGTQWWHLLLLTVGGVCFLVLLTYTFFCTFGKGYLKELLEAWNRFVNGGGGSVPTESETPGDMSTIVSLQTGSGTGSVNPISLSGGFSSWPFPSGSVQRTAEPIGPVYPEPRQEDNLKRLNSRECDEWVLGGYKVEGKTLVCKSYKNITGETKDNMMTEYFFLSNVKHSNIVECVNEPREISFNNEKKQSFFMERLEFGGLDSYLRGDSNGVANGHLMTVEDATSVVVGACRALHYVHSLGYVHADICSDNLFAFRNPDTKLLDVKLGDFESFYRPQKREDGGSGWKSVKHTALYTAPECILDCPKNANEKVIKRDAFKNDVWGIALVLWEIQSWIMCKNNKTCLRREQPGETVMNTVSRYFKSRIAHVYDYNDCRSQVHVALFQKINRVNPSVLSAKPDTKLMKEFYERIYPCSVGYPLMDPKLDIKFGWPITKLLKMCLRIEPDNRPSMREVLEQFLNHANSSFLKYKHDIASDLDTKGDLSLSLEDVDPIDLHFQSEIYSPSSLQPNLGQLSRSRPNSNI